MKNLSEQVNEEFARHQALVSSDDQELLETDEVMSVQEFSIHEDAVILTTQDDGMEYHEAVYVLEE